MRHVILELDTGHEIEVRGDDAHVALFMEHTGARLLQECSEGNPGPAARILQEHGTPMPVFLESAPVPPAERRGYGSGYLRGGRRGPR